MKQAIFVKALYMQCKQWLIAVTAETNPGLKTWNISAPDLICAAIERVDDLVKLFDHVLSDVAVEFDLIKTWKTCCLVGFKKVLLKDSDERID